ncbi:unnamed protein product [Rhizopus stolonifer]
MTRSFIQQDLENQKEHVTESKQATRSNQHVNAIFSDDEEEHSSKPTCFQHTFFKAGYADPILASSTYHTHQADNALFTLKHTVSEEEGWKKALKHKSGVVVYMKNGLHKGDKAPIFKGEAIIRGFSPQAIFYVIGMRKLWDEQYEDGNLIENLNDTTSLTYECIKSATGKSKDFVLVEKIECTQNGTINFACTSVETPKVPKISNKIRTNIKLQGWILKPLNGSSNQSTKVTFVIQESMKGWMSSLSRKTLARRPVIIAKIADYLEKKAERARLQTRQTVHVGIKRRPSLMDQYPAIFPPQKPSTSSASHSPLSKPLIFPERRLASVKKEPALHMPLGSEDTSQSLYPLNRHPIKRVESIQLLKKLTSSYDYWSLDKQTDNATCYRFVTPLDGEENRMPFIRVDSTIHGSWTAEQLCSVIHCAGARKIWDTLFENGKIVERFSQKDYLVHWHLGNSRMQSLANIDVSAVTTIKTESAYGTIYTASTSVSDPEIPPDKSESCIRAHIDLYGWSFRPNLDDQGKTVSIETRFVCNIDFKYPVPKQIMEAQINAWMHSIGNLQNYLNQYNCPPYIRRVAGKVTWEAFDVVANHYQVFYTAKHQPSNPYRIKRKETRWCTEVRFHKDMFPHGLDIQVSPETSMRCQVLFDHQTIKIFTANDSVEGKQVSLTLKPLEDDTFDYTTYKYNHVLSKDAKETKISKESKKHSTSTETQTLEGKYSLFFFL